MMTIKEEAPSIYSICEQMHSVREQMETYSSELSNNESHGDFIYKKITELLELESIYQSELELIEPSDNSVNRFISSVEKNLKSYFPQYIIIRNSRVPYEKIEYDGDWFTVSSRSDPIITESSVVFETFHPKLYLTASRRWSKHSRIRISEPPVIEWYDSKDQISFLGSYGVLGSWKWAYEALLVAERALEKMNLSFHLCDLVKWSCSGEPAEFYGNVEFGRPELFRDAFFGQSIDGEEYERLPFHVAWKVGDGNFISPLWQYFDFNTRYNEFGLQAKYLADIGRAIDSGVRSLQANDAPNDNSGEKLTPERAFRAGEAMVLLRVKLGMEGPALKGLEAEATGRARTGRSGAASSQARNRRRTSLLSKMEEIAKRSPDTLKFGEAALARLAAQEAAESAPQLWRQGAGQIGEYLDEFRRGEAGTDERRRYLALFP